ncbi:MAG TPA: hypothetical protein VFE64_14555 [Devosia sp.]|jgi:hypothetical protein|nr:hypothetical protein [Devosia sp.]
MDIVFDVALAAHLLALLAAGAAIFGIPIVAGRMASVGPEVRPVLGGLAQSLGRVSQIALVVLLISGPLMVWLRYGGFSGMNVWFWVKMGLIAVAAAAIIAGARLRGAGGAPTQAGMILVWTSRLALVGVVIAAVLAFN